MQRSGEGVDMSALEQALRQIDEQRQGLSRAPSTPTMMPLPTKSLWIHTFLRWALPAAVVVAMLMAGAAGFWLLSKSGMVTMEGKQPEGQAQTEAASNTEITAKPSTPSQFGGTAMSITSPLAPEGSVAPSQPTMFQPPDGSAQALMDWTSGRYTLAAQRWSTLLRTLPPSTMALQIGEQLTTDDINNLVRAKLTALPWLVVPSNMRPGQQWSLLILAKPAELDRTYAWLAQAGVPVSQWGTLAYWVSRGDALTAVSATPETTGTQKAMDMALAKTSPEVTPTATANATTLPRAVTKAQTPSAALLASQTTDPTRPARSSAPDAQAIQEDGGPSAARSIENEFAAVEQDLSSSRYEAALGRIGKLEENIGANWRTRYLTGVALSGLLRWREAVPVLAMARQGNTKHARIALYLSVAQQELGQHEAALESLTQALSVHAEMPELWLNKAHSLQATGQSEEAMHHYRRFIDLSANRLDLAQQRSWVQKLLDRKVGSW